ncbi:hypothetical protein [Hyphomonas sp.]|uniref:hypothetical protein n=1 Tax=Hyphomonas sp. TaxID=87 RepID=UPI0025C63253|nr:hypothetical protein [Hyphomonas sp.]
MGKKFRKRNPRISRQFERITSDIIKYFGKNHFFDEEGKLVAPVIIDYLIENSSDFRTFPHPYTKKLTAKGEGKMKRHPIDALLDNPKEFSIGGERLPLPQRWADTSAELKRDMYLHSLVYCRIPHRPICFWIGEELVAEAISEKKDLAAWMLKRISDRLKRLLGDTEFGLWFHIEHIPGEPDKLHAHGIIYAVDESWLASGNTQYTKLRDEIRKATGFKPEICGKGIRKENWVHMQKKSLNQGYVAYSTKSSRVTTRNPRFDIAKMMPDYIGVPSEEIGDRIEAVSHSLTKRAKNFYESARPIVRGFMTGKVFDWDDDDWKKAGATFDDGSIDIDEVDVTILE